MDWAIETVDRVLIQLPQSMRVNIDNQTLIEAIQFTKEFYNGNVDDVQINILAYVFKSIIDPRGLDYVSLDSIINLLAVGFTYLWGIDCKNIALILTSQVDSTVTEIFSINSTVNRSRIPKETKEILDELFPYKRVINDKTSVNLVEEFINETANTMFDKKWIPTAYDPYLIDVLGDRNIQRILPADLKIQLSEMIIKHEGIIGNVCTRTTIA